MFFSCVNLISAYFVYFLKTTTVMSPCSMFVFVYAHLNFWNTRPIFTKTGMNVMPLDHMPLPYKNENNNNNNNN
jgi:hypothetical protein